MSNKIIMPKLDAENYIPPDKQGWEFNAEVTAVFDQMLENSIPNYRGMREVIDRVVAHHLTYTARQRPCCAIDLGASRGEASARLIEQFKDKDVTFYLNDVSKPMYEVLCERFKGVDNVRARDFDLVDDTTNALCTLMPCVCIMSILTLMFLPIEERQRVLGDIHARLERDGLFVLVEKTMGDDPISDAMLTRVYLDMKRDNSYTEEAIEKKRKALRGVLVPVQASWNEQMLKAAGFMRVQRVWQSLQFVGWVAYK